MTIEQLDEFRGYDTEKLFFTDTIVLHSCKQCGNTTRQIDEAIQQLFQNKIIVCRDHYYKKDYKLNLELYQKILKRLKNEHESIYNKIIKNSKLLTITLTNDNTSTSINSDTNY